MTDLPGDRILSRALGEELRRAREACGWTRAELADRLPSGIGDRTLLSYEHGARHPTFLRLVELGSVVGVDAATLMARALLRAHHYAETLTLRVDLHRIHAHKDDEFGQLMVWARHALVDHPGGMVEVVPLVAKHLAWMVGCSHREMAEHLLRFTTIVEDTTREVRL